VFFTGAREEARLFVTKKINKNGIANAEGTKRANQHIAEKN